jgi:hypothetical protein
MGDSVELQMDAATDSGQRFLCTEDAARLIGKTPKTLNKLRPVRDGPPFRCLGRRCTLYDWQDLIECVLAQPKRS